MKESQVQDHQTNSKDARLISEATVAHSSIVQSNAAHPQPQSTMAQSNMVQSNGRMQESELSLGPTKSRLGELKVLKEESKRLESSQIGRHDLAENGPDYRQ